MSVKLMTEVWALDVPHPQQAVLLAMADHAHDDGFGHPGLRYLAWKTGYSHRQVRRIVADLEQAKLIAIHAEPRRGQATVFQLRLDRGTPKTAFVPVADGGTSWPPNPADGGTSAPEQGDTVTAPLTSTPTSTKNPSSSPVGDELCDLLADLVEANGAKRPSITPAWRREAERMLRLDHRDPVQAEAVLRWSQADDFWRSNILSMPTFRAKYDQLFLAAKRRRGRRSAIENFGDFLSEVERRRGEDGDGRSTSGEVGAAARLGLSGADGPRAAPAVVDRGADRLG